MRAVLVSMVACASAFRLQGLGAPPRRRAAVVLLELPLQPATELGLGAAETVRLVCEGLRLNDTPDMDAGIVRLYHFLTPQGRVALAPPPPRQGLQGGVTLEDFLDDAASLALGALMLCESFALLGETRISPGSQARGQLAYQLIEVRNSPLEDGVDTKSALRALVGAPDDFLQAVLDAQKQGLPLPTPPGAAQVKARFWVALEQERRPPLQDVWLIKEMLPMEKTLFQKLNEGGEEFEGEDSG